MQVGGSVGTNSSIFLWTPSDPFRTTVLTIAAIVYFNLLGLVSSPFTARSICYTVWGASPGCDFFKSLFLQKKHMIPCGTHVTLFQSWTLLPNVWTSCCLCFGISSSGLSFFSPSKWVWVRTYEHDFVLGWTPIYQLLLTHSHWKLGFPRDNPIASCWTQPSSPETSDGAMDQQRL